MKHNAEQFDLFDKATHKPGDIVRLLVWGGRKWIPSKDKYRVISWPLYFLLSGDDPEGWRDDMGYMDNPPPDPSNVPLVRLGMPELSLYIKQSENPYFPRQLVTEVEKYRVCRGY